MSRRFGPASAKAVQQLAERRLEAYDIVALVLDGKTFDNDGMVIVLGITATGQKLLLSLVQTATDNERVCAAFLRELVDRGLRTDPGLLGVIDGFQGLRKALQTVFGGQDIVQRYQWHKRESVLDYLPQIGRPTCRWNSRRPTSRRPMPRPRRPSPRVRTEVKAANESTVKSLDEGFEETLTPHRPGLFRELGVSLKTANCLESINAQVARGIGRVTSWRTADQKHRWVTAALPDIESRPRRLRCYRALPLLRAALQTEIQGRTAAGGKAA